MTACLIYPYIGLPPTVGLPTRSLVPPFFDIQILSLWSCFATRTSAIDWKLGASFQSSGYGSITCDINLLKIARNYIVTQCIYAINGNRMCMRMECWIVISKNSLKLKHYYYFHAKFLKEIQYVYRNTVCMQLALQLCLIHKHPTLVCEQSNNYRLYSSFFFFFFVI